MPSDRLHNSQAIKDLVRQILVNGGMEKKMEELDVIQCFHELMGNYISSKTSEVRFRNKTLVIRLQSGVLKEELSYGKSRIKQLINDRMGHEAVKEVEVW